MKFGEKVYIWRGKMMFLLHLKRFINTTPPPLEYDNSFNTPSEFLSVNTALKIHV